MPEMFIAVISAMLLGFTLGLIGGIVIAIELMEDICWVKNSGSGRRSCVECVSPTLLARWLRKIIHPWSRF